MQFTSISFLIFTTLVFFIYYLTPGKRQWIVLLIANFLFYCFSDVRYLIFILLTALDTYITALLMQYNCDKQMTYLQENKHRLSPSEIRTCKEEMKTENRHWLIMCLIFNFLILFVCKGLIIDPFRTLSQDSCLSFLALGLPLGISFYMFQSTGYVIDVYRGKATAEQNFFKLALFVSFFPQLIQGPINKHSQLAPQLLSPHPFNRKTVSFGLQRMLWGYFKKLVIADRIAAAVIALKAPEYTGTAFLMLTVFYAVQIYADFTGGIDISIGIAQAFGITLPENFVRPYFSKNIAEYWRRWHITLGEWMKNYIFFPISVSKPMLKASKKLRAKYGAVGKRLPVYAASLATWFVTGIWHGLTPNFILWGLMNCIVIVVSEELNPLYDRFHNRFHLKQKNWYAAFEILRTFLLMNLIRIVDLFPDVSQYFSKLGSLFSVSNVNVLWDGTLLRLGLSGLDYGILAGGIIVMFCVSLIQEKKGSIRELMWEKHPYINCMLIFALFLITLLMGNYGIGYNASNFIYNQF